MAMNWISICILSVISIATAQQQGWKRFELTQPLTNFRTVHHESSKNRLYLGGVNTLYEFNSENITQPLNVLSWNPLAAVKRACLNYKADNMLCQNNVAVLQPINATHLYTCGTMAYSPICTYVRKHDFGFESVTEHGKWKTAYDPYVSTVSVIANQTLFTATQDSLQGNNGIISRTLNGVILRTQESDKYWLNDPVFVGGSHVRYNNSLHDKVMIFFREKAEEFQPYKFGLASHPSTRNIVSRVATVCVNDHGGSAWVLNRKFATYQKMSIVCTSKTDDDDTAFRYTHLESTFELENSNDPYNPTIFGLFTTANDAVSGTAVCAFTMRDLLGAISINRYWARKPNGDILATEYPGTLSDGPGECVHETRNLSQSRLTFSKQHPIKFGTVYPSQNTPFYAEPATRYKHVVVHKVSKENSSLDEDVTVIFMITMEGRLKRVVYSDNNPKNSWSLPDIQAVTLAPNECVISLKIGEKDLFVVTNRSVTQVPLAACSFYQGCSACRLSRDPYCVITYEEICVPASIFGSVQLAALSSIEIVCSNYTPPITPSSENAMLMRLQANLTILMQQNAQAMRSVADLTVARDQKAQEHGACSETLQQRMQSELAMSQQVRDLRRTLDETRRNKTVIQNKLSKCKNGELWFAEQIRRLTEELNSRPSRAEFDEAIEVLKSQRTRISTALTICAGEKKNLTERADKCASTLRISQSMIARANATCREQRQREIASLKAEIHTVKEKASKMHDIMKNMEQKQNFTSVESYKKLGMCKKHYQQLFADHSLLRKKVKNLSLHLGEVVSHQKKQRLLIQQLQWLHKKHGQRGQQGCAHNGWFQSNATGNRFLLGKIRSTWENAKRFCQGLNARLAVFRSEQELRYINNVIRAYEPTRNFWIGLVKNDDGSLTWLDGTPVIGTLRNRFPQSQRARMRKRTKYCVEINPYQRWILTPCARIRKPLCQRVGSGTGRPFKLVTMRTATTAYRKYAT